MALERFRAPALPIPNAEYDQRTMTDIIRALRLYFNQLDSLTPNQAQSYRADNFYGGEFDGTVMTANNVATSTLTATYSNVSSMMSEFIRSKGFLGGNFVGGTFMADRFYGADISGNGNGLIFPNGAWYDNTASQTAADVNTPYPIKFRSTTVENQVTISDYVTTFVGSIGPASTTMTVTSTTGIIEPGMLLTGNSVTAGTTIHKQLSGTAGSTGTYQVSTSQTRGSGTFTGTAAKTVVSSLVNGYFDIQFSLQISKSSGGSAYVWVWPRVNGIDIPDSNTKLAVQGTNSEVVAAWNFVLPLDSGDKFQLMWATDDTGISLLQEAANAFSPAIPSAIITATFVSALSDPSQLPGFIKIAPISVTGFGQIGTVIVNTTNTI